jgi:hypothetical protein
MASEGSLTDAVEALARLLAPLPDEVARLLRLLHGALGDLEGTLTGLAGEADSQEAQRALAAAIAWRAGEIAGVVAA